MEQILHYRKRKNKERKRIGISCVTRSNREMFSQNLENWAGSPRPDSVGYDKLWKLISLARERKPRENLLRFRLLSIPDSTVHTHKVSPQCDWLDESSDDKLDWMTSRIQLICTVSLQCVLTCDPSVCRLDWIMCCIQVFNTLWGFSPLWVNRWVLKWLALLNV